LYTHLLSCLSNDICIILESSVTVYLAKPNGVAKSVFKAAKEKVNSSKEANERRREHQQQLSNSSNDPWMGRIKPNKIEVTNDDGETTVEKVLPPQRVAALVLSDGGSKNDLLAGALKDTHILSTLGLKDVEVATHVQIPTGCID
jgi:ABC-type Fe3+-hydroxamate transport system substrate-binding protein